MRGKRKTPAERAADARVGALIRRARQTLGLRVLELGVQVGLTDASISRMERGLYPWPEDAAPKSVLFLIQRLLERLGLKPPQERLAPERAERLLSLLVAEARARSLDAAVR